MKIFVIVIDGFGMGELPDANKYGDQGANTALHVSKHDSAPHWPALQKLGLANSAQLLGYELDGCAPLQQPAGSFGVMAEQSPGKDTTTGHWEIGGIILQKPFATFTSDYPAFPVELTQKFCAQINSDILGNKTASGTKIIQELGDEHIKTKKPIIYTSVDSVFQIAAHETYYGLGNLYHACEVARKICDDYQIARVIARPFIGEKAPDFVRTKNRKDYSIDLPGESILDYLSQHGIKTISVGKISDIFNSQGIVEEYHDKGNPACLKRILDLAEQRTKDNEFIFVNLVDTDMNYGHRRDIPGYFQAISQIDQALDQTMSFLKNGDLMIITADHGCDPGFKGTDHTREYVPLLVHGPGHISKNLGVRGTFSDIAASVSVAFGLPSFGPGKSFL